MRKATKKRKKQKYHEGPNYNSTIPVEWKLNYVYNNDYGTNYQRKLSKPKKNGK